MLGTISKCGRVLDLYDADHTEWGVTEVSDALHTSKSNAHSLLASLTAVGLLRRSESGRYRLGWRIFNLQYALVAANELLAAAREGMERLAADTGEAVLLSAPDGPNIVVAGRVGSTKVVQPIAAPVGTRLPAHCTAAGKVLLAAQPWEKVEAMLAAAPLQAVTEHTITDLGKLKAELQRVRKTGIGFNSEERLYEICAVSAGIRDYMGVTIAAVSVIVPCYRFKSQEAALVNHVKSAARSISRNLGLIEDIAPRARGLNGA